MNLRSIIIYLLSFALVSCGSKKSSEEGIKIFCAASLAPVIEQIKSQWENDHPQKIIINAASSGTLARQIENGAQADIFLSANHDWMDYLISSMNLKNHPEIIASNRLAVAVPLDRKVLF